MWIRTYGRLYQKLCSTTCEVPIGIYRTEDPPDSDEYSVDETRENFAHAQLIERAEISNLVRSRMESLNVTTADYDDEAMDKPSKISYVIINPSCDLKLHEGDVMSVQVVCSMSTRQLSNLTPFSLSPFQIPGQTESFLGSEDVRETQQQTKKQHKFLLSATPPANAVESAQRLGFSSPLSHVHKGQQFVAS